MNETRTQRVSFTKKRKKDPIEPRARKKEEYNDGDEEGKTSSTKLNRNDPQGRRSSTLLRDVLSLVRFLFLIDCFLSLEHSHVSLRNAEACKQILAYV